MRIYLISQKWSKGKQKEKVNNMVLFDQATYDKLLTEVPRFKLITPSVLSDRLRVSTSRFSMPGFTLFWLREVELEICRVFQLCWVFRVYIVRQLKSFFLIFGCADYGLTCPQGYQGVDGKGHHSISSCPCQPTDLHPGHKHLKWIWLGVSWSYLRTLL
jgi:hypothetical protein